MSQALIIGNIYFYIWNGWNSDLSGNFCINMPLLLSYLHNPEFDWGGRNPPVGGVWAILNFFAGEGRGREQFSQYKNCQFWAPRDF